jgi:hypothetical protein
MDSVTPDTPSKSTLLAIAAVRLAALSFCVLFWLLAGILVGEVPPRGALVGWSLAVLAIATSATIRICVALGRLSNRWRNDRSSRAARRECLDLVHGESAFPIGPACSPPTDLARKVCTNAVSEMSRWTANFTRQPGSAIDSSLHGINFRRIATGCRRSISSGWIGGTGVGNAVNVLPGSDRSVALEVRVRADASEGCS